jgi:hypothetical protein
MTTITSRVYKGEHDRAVMLALMRTRPTTRILDFLSLYDLHETAQAE